MKLNFKTIIGFVVIAVVAYLCRPLNDKIADVYIEKNEEEISGNIEGHNYVDLGLSVKWATCNIGASKPEEYGDSFVEKEKKESTMTAIHKSYLTATSQWGEPWRIPTKEEWNELKYKCTWKWTTVNRVNGYKITAKNGHSIFLPAAGYRNGIVIYNVGSYGFYWSSTVGDGNSGYTYRHIFNSSSKSTNDSYFRYYYGYSVRPVTE